METEVEYKDINITVYDDFLVLDAGDYQNRYTINLKDFTEVNKRVEEIIANREGR